MKSSRQLYSELENIQARRREYEKVYQEKQRSYEQFNSSMSPSIEVIDYKRREQRINALLKRLNQELAPQNKHAEIVDAE